MSLLLSHGFLSEHYVYFLFFSDSTPPLTLRITTKTLPDTEEIQRDAQNNVYTLLTTEETVRALAKNLSDEFEAKVNLNNVRLGSIMVDMILEDLSKVEYIKELSDKWVLSNMIDSILMTSEFISTCLADDVAVEVVVDEESYKQIKTISGE